MAQSKTKLKKERMQTAPPCVWIKFRIWTEQKALSPKTVLPSRFTYAVPVTEVANHARRLLKTIWLRWFWHKHFPLADFSISFYQRICLCFTFGLYQHSLIMQQSRIRDGSRKITFISEVQKLEGDTIIMQDLFPIRARLYRRTRQIGWAFRGDGLATVFSW